MKIERTWLITGASSGFGNIIHQKLMQIKEELELWSPLSLGTKVD